MELDLVNRFHPRPSAYRPERAATASSGETLYAMADLKLLLTNAEDLAVNQLCTIAHLDKTGSLDSRKERLSSFLAGPTRRQRSGWLQFFVHVVDSDAVGLGPDFELDYGKLDDPDQELLSDYIQYYHLGGAFLRAPPVDVLADLQISPNEDDDEREYDFAVPGDYAWPAREAIDKLTGATFSPGSSRSSAGSSVGDGPTLREMRETLLADIGEGRIGVAGEDSAAVVRRTNAFELDPDQFFIYKSERKKDPPLRDTICDGTSGFNVPFSRDIMFSLLYENNLNATEIKRIQRRYLVPEQFHCSAPCIEDPSVVTQMGGRQGKHFKVFESLRVKQEAIVAKQQAIFYMLAKTSQVQLSLESAVKNISDHDDDNSSVAVSLRRDLYDHLLEAAAFSEHVLHAMSDSVHILGAELSEYERQKDDEVVRGAAGDEAYRGARPRAEPTKYVKKVDGLLDVSRDLRRVRKEQLQAGDSGGGKNRRGQTPERGKDGLRPGSAARRQRQSAQAKRKNGQDYKKEDYKKKNDKKDDKKDTGNKKTDPNADGG